MRYKKFTLFIIFVFCIGSLGIYAQQAILSSGGNADGNATSFSVGQVFFYEYNGAGTTITEGVQQAYEISSHVGIEYKESFNLFFSSYPNPTVDFLTLKVENYELNSLTYQLYDIHGKLLESNKLKADKTKILMIKYSPSVYFLKVKELNKELISFKIIKN